MPFLLQHHMKLHHPPVRASSAFAPTTSEAGAAAATYGRSPVIAEPTELFWNPQQEQQMLEAVMPNDSYLDPPPPPQRVSNVVVDGCTLLDPMDWVPVAHWQNDEKDVCRSIEPDEQDEKEDRTEDSQKRSLWMDRELNFAGSVSSPPLHNNNNNNNNRLFASAAHSKCQTAQPLSSPPSLLTLVRRPSACHPPLTQPTHLQQQPSGMEEPPLQSLDHPDRKKSGAATAAITDLYPAVVLPPPSFDVFHGDTVGGEEEDDYATSVVEDAQQGELSPLLLSGGVIEGNHGGFTPFSTSPSSTVVRVVAEKPHSVLRRDEDDEKGDNSTTLCRPLLPPPVLLPSNDDRRSGEVTTTTAMPPILLIPSSSSSSAALGADCLLLARANGDDHHDSPHRSHDSSLSAGAAVSTLDVLEWSMCDSLGCLSVQSTPQKPSEEGGTINYHNISASHHSAVNERGSSSSGHNNSSLYAIRAVQNKATSPQALCF